MTETKEKTAHKEELSEVDVAKKKAEEYYSKLVETLYRETNIAIRYELKLKIETVQELFKYMFEG